MIALRHVLVVATIFTIALLELTPSDILAVSALIMAGVATWIVTRRKELKDAFDTRGQMIDDLHEKCGEFEQSIAEMRGEMNLIQGLKSQEIAIEVARLLKDDRFTQQPYEDDQG